MKRKFFIFLFYILFIVNSNLLSDDSKKTLRVGLLAPLSGPYSEIGNSLLYSLQLALEEIDDKNVVIVPRDSGFSNKEKLEAAVNEMRSSGVKVIIGPSTHEEFNQVKKYNDVIFISLCISTSVLNYWDICVYFLDFIDISRRLAVIANFVNRKCNI